ncbi:MAG: efflux transporter periplasmic adaptor subunit, partial [Xanthobacteraceae bacterium]
MNAKGRRAKIWTTAALAAHAAIALVLPLRMAMADASDSSERAVTVTAAKNVCFENTISVSGVVAPKKEVLVRPDREGLQILQINAQAGDTVRSGQVLARLIPPEGQPAGNVEVQSPVAGLVTSSSAMVGAIVSAQRMPLFQIAEGGEMELVAETPVKTLQTLALNQPA